ncbi:distal tail protein Dit, partial [Ornithinibacillus sp. JPR2-1]|uniref:distal tail protein Dit n=1 Tax=Ornithinibacillus sp. JPR2-1 TaxID=2094019 RepID=UPI0031E3723C
MYNFIDTVTAEGKSTLLSLQTIFNDHNLDELLTDSNGRFVTLSVGGRGILPRRIERYRMPHQSGEREKRYTYDVREIPVQFLLEDKTNKGFRERFNRLNGLLVGSKKRLEFTDERKYFIATLQRGEIPDEETNSIVGKLYFLCTDSAKRGQTKQLPITTEVTSHVITGQTETPWKVRVNFTVPQSRFTLESSNGLYILLNYNFIAGDMLEIDYVGRKVYLNGNDLRS